MPIIITRNGKDAEKVEKSSFQSEDRLQQYIHCNPESIPLYEIEEDIRLLILAREFSSTSGPIDAIGIDENGQVYLIETKLYKNSDKRKVVAQVLDYGAALAHDSNNFSEFISSLEDHVNKTFGLTMIEKVTEFFGLTDEEFNNLLSKIKTNLDGGEFSFVVLMDIIDERLKNLIVFINQYSNFNIYGVELEYYKHNELEIIIPKLFGAEVPKSVSTGKKWSERRQWNEESFFEKLKEKLTSDEINVVRELYDFSLDSADRVKWGSGVITGTFNTVYSTFCPRSVFTIDTKGILKINLFWMEETDEMQVFRDKLRERVKEVFGLPSQPKVWGFYKEEWMPYKDAFMNAIKELVN